MGYDPLDRSQWEEEQERLVQRRQTIHADIAQGAYEAGRVRGSRGDYEPPPWMAHLHEIAPTMENPGQFAAAHKYGQTEAYVEHAHDLITDEFTPRAEAIAKEADRSRIQVGNADTQMMSAGIRAIAGGRRTAAAGVTRRQRLAHERFGVAQAAANSLQDELTGRLDEVEEKRKSLHYSPWKPDR